MRLKKIVQADKDVTSWGKWVEGTKMRKKDFPLSKNKAYRPGAKYRRRLLTFRALGFDFRLLVFYRTDIQRFVALLGMDQDSDTKVLGRLESHASHPGLHIHTQCHDIKSIPDGRLTWPDQQRIPRSGRYQRQFQFPSSDKEAFYLALNHYGIVRDNTFGLTSP